MSNNTPETPAQPKNVSDITLDGVLDMVYAIEHSVQWFGFVCRDFMDNVSKGSEAVTLMPGFIDAIHVIDELLPLARMTEKTRESIRGAFGVVLDTPSFREWLLPSMAKMMEEVRQ